MKQPLNSGPIRLGIAGLGRAGWNNFTREMEGREGKFRVVAACDILPERRKKAAQRFGCATYERVEDLIADPNVELVFVATRSCDHFRHAAAALKAGKHVHLEKPITVDHAQARRLAELARRSRGGLFVRHNSRYAPVYQHTRRIMDSGVLGEVFEIKMLWASYLRRDDWQTMLANGGGIMRNTASHMVDQALQLMGSPVKDIWCRLRRVAAVGDAEDHCRLMLVGANGRLVDIELSSGYAVKVEKGVHWTVLGTRGGLACDGNTIQLRYLDPRKTLKARKVKPSTTGRFYGTPEELPWIEKEISVEAHPPGCSKSIWDDLHAAIRLGRPYPITIEQGVEVMRVLTEARRQTEFR